MTKRVLTVLGLILFSLAAGQGQAHAMNLLVAVGNPHIRIAADENGTIQIVETDDKDLRLSKVEPASGEQVQIEQTEGASK